MGGTKTDGELIKFILDEITWSFSSVSCYAQCPRAFKMIYLDRMSKCENGFADWGSFGHYLLELYYTGKKDFYELSQIYEDEYKSRVKAPFPPNRWKDLAQSYYETGKRYFDTFQGDFDDCEILGVEEKIKIKVGKYKFVGYIDLILRDKNGDVIICDHKSKSEFKNDAEKDEYLRQLYLYAVYIHDVYGVYPKRLIFNMFRVGNVVEEIFSHEKFEKTKEWFVETIKKIYEDADWDGFLAKPDKFFCNWLCSVRRHCEHSDKYKRR